MQRWCKICDGWHDLDEAWPHQTKTTGMQIIKDIEPYKAVAVDVATGKPPVIGSRSQHREFLRRNSYIEVGNEKQTPKREYNLVSKSEIKHVIDNLRRR